MNLTKAAINRPVFILMLMLAAVLLGLLSYSSMRLEQNPEVTFGVVTVSTAYPGAGPEEINNLVSRPIESAVSGVGGLREITSTSREGVSVVVASFELSTNIDAALNDMRSKIDAISNQLPKDALKPQVSKIDVSATPVAYYAFSATGLDSRTLRDLVDQRLQDRFSQIGGVSSADVVGGDTREIEVQIKRDKMVAYGLGITNIQQAILATSVNAPVGKFLSGDQEYTVRILGEFANVDQIRNMVFQVTDPKNPFIKGKVVRLGDVAEVSDTAAERTSFSRLDGRDSIVLALSKSHDGNAVDIVKAADALSADIQKEFQGKGLKIIKTLDTAKIITDSLNDLNFALLFGILLVSFIVFLFLHDIRGTLIVCLAIPTCIFFTFIALKLAGFTINNMSMLALSLAIGVLVDDAIVVIENIYRHLKAGEDPREAAINGRSEIGLAAIAITMADVVVFLPIGFISGIVGQFFKPLALGFVFATLFSLFVSFTITPMLASRWYKAGEDMEHPKGWLAVRFERVFGRFEGMYRRALEWSLNHRWFVFILGNSALFAVINFIGGGFAPSIGGAISGGLPLMKMAVFIGLITTAVQAVRRKFSFKYALAGLAFGLLFPAAGVLGYGYHQFKQSEIFKFAFLPDSDAGQVQVNVEMPVGTSLTTTGKVVAEIERRVQGIPEIKHVLSRVGEQSSGSFGAGASGSNFGQISLTLFDKRTISDRLSRPKPGEEAKRDRSSNSVATDVLRKIGHIPGAFIKVAAVSQVGFGSAIQIGLEGDDRDQLIAITKKIRDGLQAGKIEGVINADITSKPGKPEYQFVPDRQRMADYGISVAELGASMRTMYQGNTDAKYRVNGQEYDINVMLSREDRDNPNVLSTVPLKFTLGNPVYPSTVGTIGQAPALDRIDRRNRQEEVQVTADLLPGYAAGSVQAQINAWVKQENLVPPGVTYKPLGQADTQSRESGGMVLAFLIGIVLVYMLLASLFDNLLYPLIIQMAQPQAMVGALLALVLTDKQMSVVGFIGLVALVGLVGKNAILLVDFTNTLRGRGYTRHDALVEAGPTRLRPIMMTTLALVLGMLPVALAIGAGSEFRETIGITIIGGMLLSTFLTLLVIPCSYTIFDDLLIGLGNVFRRGKGSSGSGETGSKHDLPLEPSKVLE
jgi:hydrophobic/amphiphilic exporter-1 (mainly G- bacteria), HAE1 family